MKTYVISTNNNINNNTKHCLDYLNMKYEITNSNILDLLLLLKYDNNHNYYFILFNNLYSYIDYNIFWNLLNKINNNQNSWDIIKFNNYMDNFYNKKNAFSILYETKIASNLNAFIINKNVANIIIKYYLKSKLNDNNKLIKLIQKLVNQNKIKILVTNPSIFYNLKNINYINFDLLNNINNTIPVKYNLLKYLK